MNLIRYDAACRALTECKVVDEVKTWADKAAATQAYGRMAKDKGLEVDAAEIRIRAERRLGELITAQKAAHGLSAGGRPAETPRDERGVIPALSEAGISDDLSSRSQKLAAVPEAEFESEVGEWLRAKKKPDDESQVRLNRGEIGDSPALVNDEGRSSVLLNE